LLDFVIGILFGLLSMLGFGIVDYIVGESSKRTGAFKTSFWSLVARLALLIILAPFLLSYVSLQPYDILIIILAAIAGAIGALGLSYGMRAGNISVISPITAAYPVVTIALSLIFLRELVTSVQSVLIVIIIAGTVLVSLNLKNILKSNLRKTHLGIEFALVSLVGWGAFFFFMSILAIRIGWFESTLFVTLPQLCIYLLYGHLSKTGFKVELRTFSTFAIMGFLSLLGFLAYNIGVTYAYTAIVTPISAASVLITILMAVVLLKEKLALYQKLGMVMIVVGIIFLSV
jgi:drug/metabolite transporter (DMT)-like permease